MAIGRISKSWQTCCANWSALISPIRFFRNQGLNIRWVDVPTSLQSAVGDNNAAQVHLSAQLAVGDSGDHLVAATTSESSSSRDPWSFLVGGQTELGVDSKSAVDDPIEKTGAVFGDTKSAVGDSSVSIGSAYMSEGISSARPYVAVNEGHVVHATLKHLIFLLCFWHM